MSMCVEGREQSDGRFHFGVWHAALVLLSFMGRRAESAELKRIAD